MSDSDDQTRGQTQPTRVGPKETARALRDLIEPGERAIWGLLIVMNLVAALVEMLGAALVFALASLFTTNADPSSLPVIGPLIEQLAGGDATREMLLVGVFAAVFYIFRGAVVIVETYFQARLTRRTGRRLSVRLFRGYLSLPYPFFLQRNTAELIRTAFSSVRVAINNFLTPLVKMTSDLLVSTGFVIVLILAAPWATALAFAILGPTTYVVLRWVRPKLHRLGRRSEDETAAALRTLQHSLHGIREIKVTQTDDYFTKVFDRTASRLERIWYRVALLNRAPTVLVETLVVLFIVALLLATTIGPFAAESSVAVLGLFAYAALRMMPIINRTALNVNKMRFAFAAVENVRSDLELLQSEASASPQYASPFVLESAIELRDVDFTYENAPTPALRDIDLVIKRGERLGIVGQTGAGKSTILDLILGLLTPTSGDVLVDGDPLPDLHGWLAGIGMVPQSVFLIDDTIRRNIAFGVPESEIEDARVADALKLAQLGSFVETLPNGVDTVVGERGVRLSGGQRQRVAIARALYSDPPILILDEGTSALDTATETELMEALKEASRDRTVIIVAHRLSTVKQTDRIVLLDEGRIVDIGRFDDLEARNAGFRELAQ